MASSSTTNSSCLPATGVADAASPVPASLAATTLAAPPITTATTNSSLYANESCLAEPHAKLGVVRGGEEKQQQQTDEEEASDEEAAATSGLAPASSTRRAKQSQRPPEGAKSQMQVDYNEAQENVRMSVSVEPERSLDDDLSAPTNSSSGWQSRRVDYSAGRGAPDNEANQGERQQQVQKVDKQQDNSKQEMEGQQLEEEGQEQGQEQEEELERRFFGLSLTDEMKKQLRKQRFKLFSRANLKKRKRKRQPGNQATSGADSRARTSEWLKSALTRQGTTTANYADLAQDSWLQEMQTSFHSMSKPSAPSPLMQKLFSLDKLSPSSSNSHLVGHHHHHHQMLVDQHQLAGHPRLFVSSPMDNPNNAELLNSWAAGDPTGARSALVKHAQSKMIPIEIIGLDPQVTKSILQADAAPSDESPPASFASDSSMDNPTLAASFVGPRLRPSKTSILHVHHFHTTRPLLGQTTLPVGLESKPQQQQTGRQVNLRQAFLNERGEIVYLDPSSLSTAGMPRIEPHLSADTLETTSPADSDIGPNKLPYPAGGAMVQYVPAGSQLSQQSTLYGTKQEPSRQRFFATTNGQTVSVMGEPQQQPVSLDEQQQQQQQQQQVAAQPHESSDDKMLMVAYRPQQSAGGANHSVEESLLNKYNDGQESKASMVSASSLVLRPLSGLLQSVVPHPAVRNSAELAGLPFASAMSPFGKPKLHLPVNLNSAGAQPAPLGHQEPDLMIKGPHPVDSQSFWLGAPSEPLMNSFHTLATGFKNNNSHLLSLAQQPTSSDSNPRRNQQVAGGGGGDGPRQPTNATLMPPSQDFLRKLLKGLQLQHKEVAGQNLSFASANQFAGGLKSASGPSKHLIRDINQPLQLGQPQQSNGRPTLDLSQQPLRIRNQPPLAGLNEAALRDFAGGGGGALSDTEGLGSITLAFISVVSLLTLILIAASMLYRQRRRSSVSRCANLPARSQLNLTHRTKRFMRSNFVRPDQGITPIKRADLDSNCSSPATGKLGPAPLAGQQEHLSSLDSQRAVAMGAKPPTSGADKYNQCKSAGVVPAQLLSTFNGAQSGGLATTTGAGTPTADIKTLNTRLQKSSYLKSLISSPSCLSQLGCSSGHKQHSAAPGLHKSANSGEQVCYFSGSHCSRQGDSAGKAQLEPDPAGGCSVGGQRSHSFKNLGSACDQNYSFARKSGRSADRNSIDSKHFNINRMPTINSESDNNLHSSKLSDSDSSSQQFKQRGNNMIPCRTNELINNPTRHHITDKYLMERRL